MAATRPEAPLLAGRTAAILGLGLMGGSLALALRGKVKRLVGIDRDPAVLELAGQMGFTDQLSDDPAALLPGSDLVILAAPVLTIIDLLARLPDWHPGRAVVLDLGSTKAAITNAMEALPERFDPLGGHPMCGKERSSLAEAEAGLYNGAPFALTPLKRTSDTARGLAEQLVQAVGARPVWLDPAAHDRWVAATSHVPFLLANSLAACTPQEAAPLVGPGFRSTSRLAGTPLHIMLDILETNRENVLPALGRFRAQVERIEQLLRSADRAGLAAALEQGARQRAGLLEETP